MKVFLRFECSASDCRVLELSEQGSNDECDFVLTAKKLALK